MFTRMTRAEREDNAGFRRMMWMTRDKRRRTGVKPKSVTSVDVLAIPAPYGAVLVQSTQGSYIVKPWEDAYATRLGHGAETADRVDGVDVYRKKSPLRWSNFFGCFDRQRHDAGMLPRFRVIRDLQVGRIFQAGPPNGFTGNRGYIERLTLV